MDNLHTFLQVERKVDDAKRDKVDIARLRLDHRTWESIEGDFPALEDCLFGYEVEVVDEDADVIEVVVEDADVLAMAVA